MRLVTMRTGNGTRAGRLDGDTVTELPFDDVKAVLASGPDWAAMAARATGATRALAGADLAPVVPRPEKIICIGQNYLKHIQEMGAEQPKYPTLFAKYTRALIGPRDDIVLPAASDNVDWEVELAIVIGRETRHVSEGEALGAVAGWTVFNDVSVRDWQRRTGQFLQGKTFERTTPVGPALVTLDEAGDGSDLTLRCEVDGQVMQDSRTSDLLFKPAELIAYISTIITLDPGDIIATGTPSGVGAGRKPPVFLKPGQTVRAVVEGVGELVNTCVKEGA
jgi:acylpyruvate hydrolase